MNVSALVDELPDLFLCRRLLHSLDDLRHVLPDDRAHAFPAAFPIPNMGKILGIKHSGILQHIKMHVVRLRSFPLCYSLQSPNLRLDLLLCCQILPAQFLQLAAAQPGPPAELDQLVVVGLGKVLVADAIPAAPFDLRPLPLWGLEIILVVRLNAKQLTECLRLCLNRPCRQTLIDANLKPFIGVLFRLFQRRTLWMCFFEILQKIFCMLPVGLIGIEGENFIIRCTVDNCFLFALPKRLHRGQAVIRLLVEVLCV